MHKDIQICKYIGVYDNYWGINCSNNDINGETERAPTLTLTRR